MVRYAIMLNKLYLFDIGFILGKIYSLTNLKIVNQFTLGKMVFNS